MAQAPAQTEKKPSGTPLGVAAATAATGSPPAGDKASADKPADKPSEKSDDKPKDDGTTAASGKKARNANKIFVVTGDVHEFDTPAKAEKFLNGEGAPTSYAVLRGKAINTRKKVALR